MWLRLAAPEFFQLLRLDGVGLEPLVRLPFSSPVFEEPGSDQLFTPHYVNNEDLLVFGPIEDSTRWNDQLSIRHSWKFRRTGSEVGESSQGIDFSEDSGDEGACCFRFVQSDVVSNGVEVLKGWFRPDQFNHRFILLMACS